MSQKNVNKFLAGAVTATMVATAVVTPAMAASFTDTGKLPEQIKGEVERAVELGYFQDSEKFNPAASITRGQVALVIARQVSGVAANDIAGLKAYVAKHGLEEKVTPFADVKKGETELYYSSLIVKDAGAFTQDSLNPASNITRSQMAKVVVTAFGLELDKDNQKEITDISKVSNKEYIEILASNGVTEPQNGKFNPGNNVTRSQMASFLVRAHDVEEVVTEVKVESVKAINANTLEVTGEGLKDLKASTITVAGNGVAKVEASADGKKATVTLTGVLAPNKDTNVTVKAGEETKNFTINFAFAPKTVKVLDSVYSHSIAEQRLTVLADDAVVSIDYLHTAGYNVSFKSFDKDGITQKNGLFGATTSTSTDGILKGAQKGEYTVQLVITKGSDVVTSSLANIEVRDLDNSASKTEAYEITATTVKGNRVITDTLVAGETAKFTELFVGNGQTVVDAKNLDYKLSSSDSKIISVKDKTFKAEGLGTATLTVTLGNIKQEIVLNVKGEARKATSVSVPNTFTAIKEGNQTFTVLTFDQYGDLMDSNTELDVNFPNSIDVRVKPTQTTGNSLTVQTTKGGQTGTVVFKLKNRDIVLGATTVTTSDVNNVAKSTLVNLNSGRTSINPDNALEASVSYRLKKENSDGVFNGYYNKADLDQMELKYNKDILNHTITGSDIGNITFVAKGQPGTTTVSLYNKQGVLVDTVSVTVNQAGVYVEGVNWTSTPAVKAAGQEIDLTKVLKINKSTNVDNVVSADALKLSAPIVNKVRVTSTGIVYLDKNDDGKYVQNDDAKLGEISLAATTDSNFTTTTGLTSYTAADGNKGTLIYTFKAGTTTVSTHAVTVDVPLNNLQKEAAAQDAIVGTFKNGGVPTVAQYKAGGFDFINERNIHLYNDLNGINKAVDADKLKTEVTKQRSAEVTAQTNLTTTATTASAETNKIALPVAQTGKFNTSLSVDADGSVKNDISTATTTIDAMAKDQDVISKANTAGKEVNAYAKDVFVMNTLARYLGEVHKGSYSPSKIVYNGVDYTWDTKGTLKGSNYKDANGKTLVSQIVADQNTSVRNVTFTLVDNNGFFTDIKFTTVE